MEAQFTESFSIQRQGAEYQIPIDYNNDGFPDVVSFENGVHLHLNDGTGQFPFQEKILLKEDQLQINYNFEHCRVGDLDLDGKVDIVFIAHHHFVVLFNDGSTGVDEIIEVHAYQNPIFLNHMSLGDLDGDGWPDLICTVNNVSPFAPEQPLRWFKNNGDRTFGTANDVDVIDGARFFCAVHDIDMDGDSDLVVQDNDNGNGGTLAWYSNDGFGNFAAGQIIGTNDEFHGTMHFADFNGDGIHDLLTSESPTSAYEPIWYMSNGAGAFSPKNSLINQGSSYTFLPFDTDLDGDMDIIAAEDNFEWWENDGSGSFSIGSDYSELNYSHDSALERTRNPHAADFDQDGQAEILNDGLIFSRTGPLAFRKDVIVGNSYTSYLKAADMDADGDLDLIGTDDPGIAWFENNGNFDFSPVKFFRPNYAYPGFIYNSNFFRPLDLPLVDINGDELLDVLAPTDFPNSSGSPISANVLALLQDSSGFFESQSVELLPLDEISTDEIRSVDIDMDGDLDLILSSYYAAPIFGSQIEIAKNDGNDTFSALENLYTSSRRVHEMIFEDFDLDGHVDLLSSEHNTNDNSSLLLMHRNNGDGIFEEPDTLFFHSSFLSYPKVEDLDSDGLKDIIFASLGEQQLYSMKNMGSMQFSQEVIEDQFDLMDHETIDFDMDGDFDIITLEDNEELSIYENNGNGEFEEPFLLMEVPMEFNEKRYLSIADFDGDGDEDIVIGGDVILIQNLAIHNFVLSGNVFFDQNENGLQDSLETGLSSMPINIAPDAYLNLSSSEGDYAFLVGIGNHEVSIDIDTLWNLTTDYDLYDVLVNEDVPINDTLHFGLFPDTLFSILDAEITSSFERCLDTTNLWISAKNLGTTLPNGLITLSLDQGIQFYQANIAPDSIVGQNLYWNFDSLYYFSEYGIQLEMIMPVFDPFDFHYTSQLTVNELDSVGNITQQIEEHWNFELSCSYDPNDKLVDPIGMGNEGYIFNETDLEYIIRFQNTGNDTAYVVTIIDTLDQHLDIESFQFLTSSHEPEINLYENGKLEFIFNDINLPDSGANFLGSQGFVRYRISPLPGLTEQTEIRNEAYIFFDNNVPIQTNEVLNTIYECPTLELSINAFDFCQNDTIEASAEADYFDTIEWFINDVPYAMGNQLDTLADLAGPLEIKMIISNDLCIDSTSVQVFVNPSYLIENNYLICNGDSILIGSEYFFEPTQFTDSMQTIIGCDSIIWTNLEITLIDTSLTLSENSLAANDIESQYQWIDCNNSFFEIEGEIFQVFEPEQSGSYAVILTNESCIDTSSCAGIIIIGLNDFNSESNVLIYPNPTEGELFIEIEQPHNLEIVKISDVSGRQVYSQFLFKSTSRLELDISQFEYGIYTIELKNSSGNSVTKKVLFTR
ncbi:MAG: T9SS type A sorting domain-containing protein [Bacteroidota bacterium]